jgi:hypothetical protein
MVSAIAGTLLEIAARGDQHGRLRPGAVTRPKPTSIASQRESRFV